MGSVIDKLLKQYYADGKLKQVDSLIKEGYLEFLQIGFYPVYIVFSKTFYPNAVIESSKYYRKNGKDSLTTNWYPSGVLQQRIYHYTWGGDSLTFKYNAEGTLETLISSTVTNKFYADGILKSSDIDT